MAALTRDQQIEACIELWRRGSQITYSKVQLGAALQAVEDWFEANRATLSAAINAATAPLTLTAAQKKSLLLFYMRQKVRREGG